MSSKDYWHMNIYLSELNYLTKRTVRNFTAHGCHEEIGKEPRVLCELRKFEDLRLHNKAPHSLNVSPALQSTSCLLGKLSLHPECPSQLDCPADSALILKHRD